MRIIRLLLILVIIVAIIFWVDAASHNFSGVYCFETKGSCATNNLIFHGHKVEWLFPAVAAGAVALLILTRKGRGRRA